MVGDCSTTRTTVSVCTVVAFEMVAVMRKKVCSRGQSAAVFKATLLHRDGGKKAT